MLPENRSHGQGGTVRQQSKRIGSQERGKIQRPRSSKGYRGGVQNQISSLNHATSAQHQHVGGIHHQMSAHHLPTGGINSIHNSGGPGMVPKIQMSKSEERALKSQQQQRQIIKNSQRQKSGLNNHIASHTASGFNKERSGLASLNTQSQSSTQLPSATATGNFSKMSKKQISQIQQQQAILVNSSKNKGQMKVNYDDLKKFLQKEYSAAQVQQILQ